MMFFDWVPTYTVVTPVALVVGAYLVSKVLRISFVATLLGGVLPLALPFVPLPLSETFITTKPENIIASGWLVLLCMAVGWVLVRPLVSGALASVGVVKLAYFSLLLVSLAVTGLLIADPALLQQYAPGWRGTMGLVLLCASVLSMSIALARVVKAAALFAVWACVSLVLASELFLGKLPQDILREDLRKVQSLLPESVVQGVLEQFDADTAPASAEGAASNEKLRAFVLSGSPTVGYEGGNTSFAGHLQELLSSYGVGMSVEDLSRPGATAYDLRDIASRAIAAKKPDLAFIVGWSSDSQIGRNSLGVPGLTEREAREQAQEYRTIAQYPLVADILQSRLYRFVSGNEEAQVRLNPIARVPAEEYREQVRAAVSELQQAGATVVLVAEPTVLQSGEDAYRRALEDVAQQSGALYVDAHDIVRAHGNGHSRNLIARGRLLSDEGVATVTAGAFHRVAQALVAEPQPSKLGGVLKQSFPQAEVLQHEYQLAGMRGESVNLIVDPRESAGDMLFKIRPVDSSHRYYRVVFSVNGTYVGDRRLNDREATRVRFKIPEQFMALPYVELSVRTVASPGTPDDVIGTSDVTVPVPVSVSGARGDAGLTSLTVARETRRTLEPFAASSIDPNSGEVLETLATRQPEVMGRWITSQPWGAIVVGASSAGLSGDALRYLGVEEAPGVFIGVAGSRAKGLLASGPAAQTLSMGSPIVRSMNRFILEDVTLESSGKGLLRTPSGA
jgi:hypothetical protein